MLKMKLGKTKFIRLAGLATMMLFGAIFSVNFLGTGNARSQDQKSARVSKSIQSLYQSVLKEFPDVPDITVEEVRSLQARSENWVIIDVRPENERRVSTIPGAITIDEWERRKPSGRSPIVIVYCTIGYRSASTARLLRDRGVDARNLAGGVLAWSDAGLEFVNDGTKTKRVHVYGRRWNILPADYSGVW
jgi:rhodanese-related sulfurtransferase